MDERALGSTRKRYVWSLKRQDAREWTRALAGEEEAPVWRGLLRSLPLFLLCLFGSMGSLAGGARPFAMALLCASMLTGKNVLLAALGCGVGAALSGDPVQALSVCLYFAAYAALCLTRLRPSDLSLTLLCGLFAGALPMALAQSPFEWVVAALSALASMLLSGLYASALDLRWRERELLSLEETCGLCLLLAALLLGLKPLRVQGVSPVLTVYLALCLLCGHLGGVGLGAAVGAALGAMAALGEPAQPHLAGGMALCGLLAGLFHRFGRLGSALGLGLAAALSAALHESWLAPEMLAQLGLAALLLFLLPGGFLQGLRLRLNREAMLRQRSCDAQNEARQDLRRKLEGYAQLYDNMAQILKRRPGGRQYAAVASALGAMAQGLQRPLEPDPELARACAEALDRARLPVSRIRAYKEGGEARVALGFRRHADRQQREEAVRVLSAELGLTLRLSPEQEGGEDELLLCPATRYQLLVGACRRASAEGNGSCGDNHIFRELPGGQYMLAISDGMGHGSKACDESRAAVELLEDYLAAGFEPGAAVMGVNDLLLKREKGEMFATMDLALVDLTRGQLRLLKIGAVQSYIKRGRELIALSGGALPMGIVDALSPFEGETQLQEGDVLVMLSDGVADAAGPQEGWLEKEIGQLALREPQAAAERLVERAAKRGASDDMTVLVARVFRRTQAPADAPA